MKRSALCLSLSAVMLLAVACAGPAFPSTPSTPPVTVTPDPRLVSMGGAPTDRFLFVELHVAVDGTGSLPRLMIDFPAYVFDAQSGTIRSFGDDRGFSLAPTAWGFVGEGSVRTGDAGGGAASRLTPIAQLPFTTTIGIFTGKARDGLEELRQAPVVLESVNAEGRLVALIDGRRVLLGPGASWSKVIEADVVTAEGRGHYRVTSSVTNRGWLDRSKLAPAQ